MNDPLAPPPVTRSPDTVFLLGMVLLVGIGQLLRDDTNPSRSVEIVGVLVANAWALSLVLTSTLILIGINIADRIAGQFLELCGRIVLCGSCFAYASLYTSAAKDFSLSNFLVIGLGLSSIWRIVQIFRDLRRKRQTINTLLEDQQAGEEL